MLVENATGNDQYDIDGLLEHYSEEYDEKNSFKKIPMFQSIDDQACLRVLILKLTQSRWISFAGINADNGEKREAQTNHSMTCQIIYLSNIFSISFLANTSIVLLYMTYYPFFRSRYHLRDASVASETALIL